MKIIPVDCNYVETEFATSYLLVKGKRGFFVECNTNYAIPYLVKAAAREGLSPDQIEGLAITHVHLDHAGGAGLFLKEFPQAKLYAHPRAARHAIDPSKLVLSATAVYGEAFMQKLYGTILPCAPDRVVVLEDGASIPFAGGQLMTKHTRGHANHHLVVIEPETKTLFSGDSFGVSYPKINIKHHGVILASTSPTDFDGAAAIETVNWIAKQDLNQIGLTHFGFIQKKDIPEMAEHLRQELQFSTALVHQIMQNKLSEEQVTGQLTDWTVNYFKSLNVDLDAADLKHLELDLKVNAQGLCFAASKH